MNRRTWIRVLAAVAVTVTAYSLLGAVGLWGVALAAPALLLAPSRGKVVRVREEPATPEAALAEWSKADDRD
jgi:gas vesicle protein